jgi:hypothetical protein
MNKFLLISLLFLSIQSFTQEPTKKEIRKQKETEEYNATVALINSKKFEFTANQALPQGSSSIDLTSNPNYLTIKNDSVYCEMPFFGRAYSVDYNGPGGYKVTGIIYDFEINNNTKKQSINIGLKLKGPTDNYQFRLNITRDKNATLTITSNNRASISYWGIIDELKTPVF